LYGKEILEISKTSLWIILSHLIDCQIVSQRWNFDGLLAIFPIGFMKFEIPCRKDRLCELLKSSGSTWWVGAFQNSCQSVHGTVKPPISYEVLPKTLILRPRHKNQICQNAHCTWEILTFFFNILWRCSTWKKSKIDQIYQKLIDWNV